MATPVNVIVDLSPHNGTPDLAQAGGDGIIGVTHKATQGFKSADPMYAVNRRKATDAGLLWGGYHFGVAGDGSEQADHFLETVQPDAGTLLVLDYEPNPHNDTMSLDQARQFVSHVDAVLGRSLLLLRSPDQAAARQHATGPSALTMLPVDRAVRAEADAHPAYLAHVDAVAVYGRAR